MEKCKYSSSLLTLQPFGVSQQLLNLSLYPGERTLGTHCIEGRVGPTVNLDFIEKGKSLVPANNQTTILPKFQPID